MKKILSLIVVSFCMILTSNAQNLIDFWNGYTASTATYATGEGSQANKWGWSTNPATAVTNWNTANGSGNIRYMDNVSGYDAGRIMYIRWDGVVSTSGKYYLKLDTINSTKLTAGHAYTFTWSYAWNSNGSAPTITTTVCTARDGSGAIAPLEVTGTNAAISGTSATFPLSTTAKSMTTGSLTFLASKDGDYYISFGANTASLCAIRDLSLVDKGTDYAALAELQKQTDALTLGDLSKPISSNLTLPTTAGTQGVTIKWASSNNAVVDTFGVVTRPQTYNALATLTATLSMVLNGKTYNQTKSFRVIVAPVTEMPTYMARWKFDNSDITSANGVVTVKDQYSGFVGTVKNEASIRTIGNPGSAQYNVLYTGNGSGYLDMGTEIGKAIYSLTDYTMCGYFRIDDDYTAINSNGNFYWTFSNTDSAMTKPTGYIIGSLKAESQSVSSNRYDNGNQATGANVNAGLGKWHHFAYTQSGNTGTVYIDGVQVAQSTTMTNLPATTLPKAGLTGTLYNWLGRSNYVADSYLRKTMLYDFQVLSTALTPDDIAVTGWNEGEEGVISTLGNLEAAYAQNPNYVNTDLNDELTNLTFAKLTSEDSTQVTSNLTLPAAGLLHNNVAITWSTSNNKVITADGQVTRPDYYPYTVTLTANLSLNGQKVSKTFHPTVLVKP
ncbi:MAG: LamG-like jellyroll fold domain-containing protein, partial [Bacteroidota bacterium]|nr:LamG-like jellyroll fold domain-containing protein [Bacteroidota bacterium]